MSLESRNYLRSVRKKAGLTQPELAFLLSLDHRTLISKLENRKRPITAHVLLSYCLIFDCHPADILPDLAIDILKHTKANAATLINIDSSASQSRSSLRQESLQKIFVRCISQ